MSGNKSNMDIDDTGDVVSAQQQQAQQQSDQDPFESAINEQLGEEAATQEGDNQQKPKDGEDAGNTATQDSGGSTTDSQQQQGQEKKGQEPSSAKDLTLADGTVIKAGMERRLYEQRELLRQQLSQRDNTANQLRESNQQLRTRIAVLEQSQRNVEGYQAEDLSAAVQLHRALKSDPTGTLKLLLTEAAKNGITVDGIGGQVSEAAIVARVEEILDSRLNNQQPSEQELIADAEREANEFFGQYPDAKTHDAVLARMLEADANLSLVDAYFQLKHAVIERGLDWSQPLAAQVQPSAKTLQQQPNNPQPPMPHGRAVPGAQAAEAGRISVASADASFNNIVKEAMREAGLATN